MTDEEMFEDIEHLREWARDVFQFTEETMGVLPSEPLDELRGVMIPYVTPQGEKAEAMLFDQDGRLTWGDLEFYTFDMFKNQAPAEFKKYNGSRFTWQQTVILESYNRALNTFGQDSFDVIKRWISIRSGHGIGKTGCISVIAMHFLFAFPGAQIGMTANTEQQVQDIFMKEFSVWKAKLPQFMQDCLVVTADHIRMEDSEDWFLRAQVARPDRPEALAGLHGEFILIIADETSGIADKVFEVMKGALTGDNYIVIYVSNPTRNEGEFYESQKAGAAFTHLHFSSRHSPIVKPGYVEKMELDYPGTGEAKSDEVLIRVDGEFAGTTEMDDKGWIPLFANMRILFEPERGQIIKSPIIGVDPAGRGRDSSIIHVRDNIYLKEVLSEKTSSEKDLARKVETVRDAYGSRSDDVGVDAFGVGAKVVANIETKVGETVNALLTDKPREGTEKDFNSFKSELGWRFRTWVSYGGIIITNNSAGWLKVLEKIKYKRDLQGRICLMDKVTFKKIYGFSPDRFDAAIHTFFKEEPTRIVPPTKEEQQKTEHEAFMAIAAPKPEENMSSM